MYRHGVGVHRALGAGSLVEHFGYDVIVGACGHILGQVPTAYYLVPGGIALGCLVEIVEVSLIAILPILKLAGLAGGLGARCHHERQCHQ